MAPDRKTVLAACGVVAGLLIAPTLAVFVTPVALLGIAGGVSGEMPSDAHIYYSEGPRFSVWPPRVTLEGGWHTCSRPIDEFEGGSFLLDLPQWRVTPYSPIPESWPYWAVVLACPPGGTVTFEGTACSASESRGSARLFVGYEVTDRTLNDDVAMIEVTITPAAELLDDHGDPMQWGDFMAALRESPEVELEVQRSNDTAIVNRVELR